jgi:hypothetical protein
MTTMPNNFTLRFIDVRELEQIDWKKEVDQEREQRALADIGQAMAQKRRAKAQDDEEQACVVCEAVITEIDDLGAVIVAKVVDSNGKGSRSTSGAVCSGCTGNQELALKLAEQEMRRRMGIVDDLFRGTA